MTSETAHPVEALVAALQWVRANYASGPTSEINARIDAALKATGG